MQYFNQNQIPHLKNVFALSAAAFLVAVSSAFLLLFATTVFPVVPVYTMQLGLLIAGFLAGLVLSFFRLYFRRRLYVATATIGFFLGGLFPSLGLTTVAEYFALYLLAVIAFGFVYLTLWLRAEVLYSCLKSSTKSAVSMAKITDSRENLEQSLSRLEAFRNCHPDAGNLLDWGRQEAYRNFNKNKGV